MYVNAHIPNDFFPTTLCSYSIHMYWITPCVFILCIARTHISYLSMFIIHFLPLFSLLTHHFKCVCYYFPCESEHLQLAKSSTKIWLFFRAITLKLCSFWVSHWMCWIHKRNESYVNSVRKCLQVHAMKYKFVHILYRIVGFCTRG